jgi:predicted YcjX-like family ATPase
MDSEKRLELARLHNRTREATEIYEMAQRLEDLTKDTPAWYAGTRAKVEARAALEQAGELRRVLEELGEGLRGDE